MATSPTSPSIQIYLLGRFEVVRQERVLTASEWTRRKAAALLQRLALERRLLKDQAIDFLWPEASVAAGANNLYRAIHAMRQMLDTTLGPGAAASTFTFEDSILSLGDTVWVDVHAFEQLCSAALAARPSAPITNLQKALTLYQGDLLPDNLYAEWTLAPRESLQRLQREASLALAERLGEARDYSAAITRLLPLLARDPADEPVHRKLIYLYALAGRRHEALRQYQTCLEALAAELNVSPEAETTALYNRILNGELVQASPPAPLPAWMPPAPVALEVERSMPLVGREAELENLRAQMHSAWRGRGQTILIAGESGVGKTRLAYEALQVAASAGMATLFGAAYEQEGQLPYQPFIEAFDRYLVEHQRPVQENPITHFKRLDSTDPQQEQWALFNATANFLSNLATQEPVVLLVDDLHAADETSLRLFHYLARQTRAAPVILMATFRSDVVGSSPSTGALLNTLYRERLSETLNLIPLTEEAVAKIIAHILNLAAAPPLVKAIFDVTEGNPFFVQEITRELLKSIQIEGRDGQRFLKPGTKLPLPVGLRELLRERVMRLGPPVESVLVAAAVVGREFRFEILRAMDVMPDNELLDALDMALASQLLEETASGYCFRHALIRQALYDSLSRARRAQLHSRVAEAIEAIYAQRPEGLTAHVEALAFHYDLSDRRQRALPYLLQAGQKAAGIYAFEVAVGHFERALALMDETGLADPAQRWAVLEALGWWGIILADTPRTVARFEQALAWPPSETWQPTGPDRARLHRGVAMALLTAGDTVAAETHLRAALAEIDEHHHAADYAHVLYNVAQLHWHRNEYQPAFDAAQRSLAIAERLDNPAAIARAFEMLALACHSLGEWQQGLNFESQRSSLAGSSLDVTEAFDVHL